MKFLFNPLFAKQADPSQGQSGGRGLVPPSDAANPMAASDGFLPIDDPEFPIGQPVMLQLESGDPVTGFKDPVYGFMDARGVVLAQGMVPNGWKPL